ncbi:CTB family bacteriocin [Okeanomitos corallinicola TIOX110]|uniref:CTB family bacteriocin n=1 Tax=Okeanomitos corallinicola TIOX110 TaxID=3133117 RepID=A0ABZ2UTQ1_9CYAN
MLLKIIQPPLLMEIPNHDQELIKGGNKAQMSNNKFTQENSNTFQANNADKFGNISQVQTDFSDVNSGAQSILSSDVIGQNQSHGINTLTAI